MKNSFVKGLLIFCGVMASIVGAIVIFMQIFKKFFNVSIEFSPKYENEACDCGECDECCEDAVEEEAEEIEFSLSEEDNNGEEPVNA